MSITKEAELTGMKRQARLLPRP